MDRTNLNIFINNLCHGMKFKDGKQEAEFKAKLAETFLKYEHLVESVENKKFENRYAKKGMLQSFMSNRNLDQTRKLRDRTYAQLSNLIHSTSSKQIGVNVYWGASVENQIRNIIQMMKEAYSEDIRAENNNSSKSKRDQLMENLDARDQVDQAKALANAEGKEEEQQARESSELGERY